MLNHIVVHGRLTRDPEVRRTQSGVAVAGFAIACDQDFTGKDGQRGTDFFDCSAWRQTAEFISTYFRKGQEIIVSGRLGTREWNDNQGGKRKVTEIVVEHADFCGSRRDNEAASAAPAAPRKDKAAPAEFSEILEDDDELPF